MIITTIFNLLCGAKGALKKMMSFKAICGLAVAISIAFNIFLWKSNKRLSAGLEMAKNNVESYEGILFDKIERNRMLMFDVQQLENSNDRLVLQLDSVIKSHKIKPANLQTAATQTQEIFVTTNRGVEDNSILINTPSKHYRDSILFNLYTIVQYDITEDTVTVGIDIKNTQYLYTYEKKEWKNTKPFLKRLFTFDFKKKRVHNYEIVNTNDLIKTSDVRVIEIKE